LKKLQKNKTAKVFQEFVYKTILKMVFKKSKHNQGRYKIRLKHDQKHDYGTVVDRALKDIN